MATIVTLTPNPAIDVSTSVDRVVPILKLRCAPQRRDPGGGGVNVARVVRRFGAMSRLFFLWEAIAAARKYIDAGKVAMVALSLGRLGAMLITRQQALRSPPLPIKPVSAIGAGDSFLGAIVYSLAKGDNMVDAFRLGVAAGSAALIQEGTELCRPADVYRLSAQVTIASI
jgi:fructose-1-phosphate kinase PfkB-like protein